MNNGGDIRPDDEKDKVNGGRISSQQQLKFEDDEKIGFDVILTYLKKNQY